MKVKFFWDVTPCRLVICYRRFEGAYCLHSQVQNISSAAPLRWRRCVPPKHAWKFTSHQAISSKKTWVLFHKCFCFNKMFSLEYYTVLMVLLPDAVIYRDCSWMVLDQLADRFSFKYKYTRRSTSSFPCLTVLFDTRLLFWGNELCFHIYF